MRHYCFTERTLIYLLLFQEAWKEMKVPLAHRYFAALLVTIAVLSLAPTLAHATQQSQTETITVNMTGQATAIGSGLSGTSTLKFTADAYNNSNQWLIIQNVTGSLQIDSTTFQLTSGQGSISNFGAAAIFADTNSGKDQLILQGTMNGQTLTFDSPSQLTSTSYLSLSGTINENPGSTGTLSVNPANTVENVTSLTTGLGNNTQITNSTTTLTVEPQNTTNTQSENMTTTTNANSTLPTTLNSSTNSTIPASGNVPPSSGIPTPANVTVTQTQYLNQTISVTQTVANVTISYIVTYTVANTTITQANVTTTVNATTTNTTSTGT
jgi:hypothetical protein